MVFETSISKSVEAAKSSVSRVPLCMTDSKLGTEYEKLAMEVLSRC
jgi:chromosome partitioning protein